MLYCFFGAWLPVCSMLNSAELLRRAPASARNIEVLRICAGRHSGLPELGQCRHAAQRTCWKLTRRLKWKWNLSAPLAWRRRNATDTYPVEKDLRVVPWLSCPPLTPHLENHCLRCMSIHLFWCTYSISTLWTPNIAKMFLCYTHKSQRAPKGKQGPTSPSCQSGCQCSCGAI